MQIVCQEQKSLRISEINVCNICDCSVLLKKCMGGTHPMILQMKSWHHTPKDCIKDMVTKKSGVKTTEGLLMMNPNSYVYGNSHCPCLFWSCHHKYYQYIFVSSTMKGAHDPYVLFIFQIKWKKCALHSIEHANEISCLCQSFLNLDKL